MPDKPLVSFLTPVGPGHQKLSDRARRSVDAAAENAPEGAFLWLPMNDPGVGRSATRNRLLDCVATPWLFWLDADDEVKPDLWSTVEPHMEEHDALWGVIETNREGIRDKQVPVASLDDLLKNPIMFCINIGFLVRTEVQRRFRWNESMDCGEDVDMYLRLWDACRCKKLGRPIYFNNRGQHTRGHRSKPGGVWVREAARQQKQWLRKRASGQ